MPNLGEDLGTSRCPILGFRHVVPSGWHK